MTDITDPYATARANLRDNVKTMATILAATAGAVIAGSSFSGLGAIELDSPRLWFAAIFLTAVACCMFIGWKVLTFTLRPDTFDASILKSTTTVEQIQSKGLPSELVEELLWVKRAFELERAELLPDNIDTYEGLGQHVETLWRDYQANKTDTARKDYDDYKRNLVGVRYWGSFKQLSYRVAKGLAKVRNYGILGLFALLAYTWSANPPKKEDASPKVPFIQVLSDCTSCTKPSTPANPAAQKVLFAADEASLDASAFVALNATAAVLRQRPELGALLLVHTDTVANTKHNVGLAAKRAQAVRQALTASAGIAASRIFASELPKSDLRILTGDATPHVENRSVEILFVVLPLPMR